MQIETNTKFFGLNGPIPAKATAPKAVASGTEVAATGNFDGATALEKALGNVPDVRPEVVARARELVADPNYPSTQTIKALSSFLAKKLTSQDEQ